MLNATRIRLYPTKSQAQALAVQFGCVRWVWNEAITATQKTFRETGKGLTYYSLSSRLPKLKEQYEWLKNADSQTLQQTLKNLVRAYASFFGRRSQFPRFKSKHGRQSIQYPQRVKIEGSKAYLPKVGWVRCVVHRGISGAIKTVTISRNACGKFHAAILTEDGIELPKVSTEGKAIGVDVGLTHLAVTSDGSKFDNPRHLNKAARNLKRKQQSLSRKTKGSKSRDKARKLVSRAHERIACARKDHLHKLSRRIVNENQVIAVETLNVKGMMKLPTLSRAISDTGWSMLSGFLEYKAARDGKAFVKIARWFPSSKACSCCGAVKDKMPLDVRSWGCPDCGAHHDRDVNAAKNIRDEGLRILAGGSPATASGGDVSRGSGRNSATARSPSKLETQGYNPGVDHGLEVFASISTKGRE